MEKSGQRVAYTKIIDEPALKSPLRYLIEGSVTLFLWSLWAYWISPVVTAVLWFLGIRLFQTELILKAGFEEFMGILKTGGLLVLLITLFMLSWIYYNYIWFLKRGERRGSNAMLGSDENLARITGVDLNVLKEVRGKNRIEVEVKDEQTIMK
jgi:poly-beta-1,6-N-acetyl-D-glucosamine biosynthesis protein PgaD